MLCVANTSKLSAGDCEEQGEGRTEEREREAIQYGCVLAPSTGKESATAQYTVPNLLSCV